TSRNDVIFAGGSPTAVSLVDKDNASDKWIWRPNIKEGFTVKWAYNILAQAEQVVPVELNKIT
ncbi:hypothetical protein A2U01_0044125, partial [Trifolium medium]|nr:hypothetical protein [Trifolium medium]